MLIYTRLRLIGVIGVTFYCFIELKWNLFMNRVWCVARCRYTATVLWQSIYFYNLFNKIYKLRCKFCWRDHRNEVEFQPYSERYKFWIRLWKNRTKVILPSFFSAYGSSLPIEVEHINLLCLTYSNRRNMIFLIRMHRSK